MYAELVPSTLPLLKKQKKHTGLGHASIVNHSVYRLPDSSVSLSQERELDHCTVL